uniref:DUF1618 domain-containing protein n=2 Tax=Aegilops tauschii subsp. strangulata TaxID=200361 RepID=A0A453MD56_AEGTS
PNPQSRTATMAAGNPRFPDFAILDAIAYISDLRDATTAWTLTTAGLTLQVSLVVAAPPRLSYFCVCCVGRDKTTFTDAPDVVCSVGDHALIRVGFTTGDSTEHFIYRARGPDGRPSLDLLPDFDDYTDAENLLLPLGFVSHRKHLVIAALSDGPTDLQYYLHTRSTEPHSRWSKKLLRVEFPRGAARKSAMNDPVKVIALGGGLLGWVNLMEGILICDVLDPGVTALRFVPMPKLLPSNNELYDNESRARAIRDVTFSRGYIRCVEFEELVERRATTGSVVPDPWDMDELQDSEPAIDPPQEEEEDVIVGWRLITWYRTLTWNCWRKGNTVHSDELGTVSLPQIGGGGACALKVPLKDLKTAAPTLRGDGDVVYLATELHEQGETAWIVAVDTKRKLVGELMPCSSERLYLYDPTYIPYVLTEYLVEKSDKAQVGKRNACHAPAPNTNRSKKQRQQLLQAGLEGQPSVPQLLQPPSVMIPVSSAQYACI